MTDQSDQHYGAAGGAGPGGGAPLPPGGMTPQPPQQSTPPPIPAVVAPRQCRKSGWRIVAGIFIVLLILSGVLNVVLIGALATGAGSDFEQSVLVEGELGQTIAVYTVQGVLDGVQADRFARLVHELAADSSVRALVLRVESPGGGISPSDQMHAMVRRLQEEADKPVVVSMGGVAASGGYYISAPAAAIYAEPTTITGSIGVLANWVVLRGTLEKIGAEPVVMRSDAARGWKDEISPFRQPDDRQRAHLQDLLNAMQDRFERVVRDGRGSKLNTSRQTYAIQTDDGETIRHTETAPFNGKVYLAEEAMELGLVDGIGGQGQAVAKAAELAALQAPRVVQYMPRYGLLARMLYGEARTAARELGGATGLYSAAGGKALLDELQTPRLQFLWKAE